MWRWPNYSPVMILFMLATIMVLVRDFRGMAMVFMTAPLRLVGAWLGLGHYDGGSTGSGTIEAHCLVVDGPLALEALRRELASSKFSNFRARLSPDGG